MSGPVHPEPAPEDVEAGRAADRDVEAGPAADRDAGPQAPPGADPGGAGPTGRRPDGLTHLDVRGQARMVDVGAKSVTGRVAVAVGTVLLAPETAARLVAGDLPKGDALPVVRLAGIQAAKRTPELLPLCHHVALTGVDVEVEVDVDTGRVELSATARAADRTGVEMEALTAVSVAALTLYDLTKAVQRDVRITDIRLRHKSGGRAGTIDLD